MKLLFIKWFGTAAYAFTLLVGVIFILLTYHVSTQPASATHTPPSFAVALTIIIPLIIIWMVAVYGAVSFKSYSYLLRKSKGEEGLGEISTGLLWLVLYIMLLPMVNNFVFLARGGSYFNLAVSLGNFVPLLVVMASVYKLYNGSKKLYLTVRAGPFRYSFVSILFGVASGVFLSVFVWGFYTIVPTLQPLNGIPKFVLPVNILLLTYVLPHLALWVLGIIACKYLSYYASKAKGMVYHALFRDLYKGILLAYVSIFLAQVLIISPITYGEFNVGVALIYGLLLVAIAGFVGIAQGAAKLAKYKQLI